MIEKLEHKSKLNLDNPDDVDWLYNWAQQAQRELEYLRSKVSPFEARVSPKVADIKKIIQNMIKYYTLKPNKDHFEVNADRAKIEVLEELLGKIK